MYALCGVIILSFFGKDKHMPKFEKARYSNTRTYYTVEQLDKLVPEDAVLQNLFCENCNCPLTFHHSGKRKAYLSTKPGYNHSESCNNKLKREAAVKRRVSRYSGSIALTRTQQARLAKSGYRAWMNRRNGTNRSSKRKSISKRVTKKTIRETRAVFKPVADSNGTVPVGDAKENVQGRTPLVPISNIGAYIGQAIKVAGEIGDVHVGKNITSFKLIDQSNEVTIKLNEATFRNSAAGLKNVFLTLKSKLKDNFKAFCCAVVDVIPDTEGNPMCILRTEYALVVNGTTVRIALKIH